MKKKTANSFALETKHNWKKEEVETLFHKPLFDLIFSAQAIHRHAFPENYLQLSTLQNIKSGQCSEDCSYCSQSARYKTGIEEFDLVSIDEVEQSVKRAKQAGATRFCMGAAWRAPKPKHMSHLIALIKKVKQLGLESCLTAGMLTEEQAASLKEAGLDYYNHNIDTSPAYYPKVVSTRQFSDRLATLEAVRSAGIKVCCGGIVGLGESEEDRIEMLRILANLPEHPQSVPINLLVPIEGTPLEKNSPVHAFDMVRVIALARVMMPKSYLRLSAGRATLSEEAQALCFLAGANSVFFGDALLTTQNAQREKDVQLFARLGLKTSLG